MYEVKKEFYDKENERTYEKGANYPGKNKKTTKKRAETLVSFGFITEKIKKEV